MDEREDRLRRRKLAAFVMGKRHGVDPHAKRVDLYARREERIGREFTQQEAAEALQTSISAYAAQFGLRDDERTMLFRLAVREFAIPLTSTSLLIDGPAPNSAYLAAITSPAEIGAAARELTRIRQRYHEDGISAGAVRPRIAESWSRCTALRVDPNRKSAPAQDSLDDLRGANEKLLRAAGPTVARLRDELAGTGYIVVITDARGHLLKVTGGRETRRMLARLNFECGADWSEAAIGTNAIGTAIADGRPLQLLGAEHFCDAPQPFTCTAAPIHAFATGEIAGVLDISGPYTLVRPHLVGVIMQAALEIEERMAAL